MQKTELKFNSAVCTTKEQSQRLLNLGLKPETADMYITNMSNKGLNYTDDYQIGSISFERVMSFWKEKGLKLGNTAWEIIPAWSLHRLIKLYKDVEDTSMWSLENVNYNRLIQCISLAIKHGAFNKEYLKQ